MTNENEMDGVVTGINVTPLVDITLVLLIIFMVTAHFVNDTSLKVHLPKVAAAEVVPAPALTVSVNKEGKMQLMGQEVDAQALGSIIEREVALNHETRVVVAADEGLVYGEVIGILDSLKKAGVSRVALSAEKR